jgi:Fe-S cluster assembly iron-binding protein IscA
MIQVTEKAKDELKRVLTDNVDNPLAGLRLVYDETEIVLGLRIDVEEDKDVVIEHLGSKVLIVKEDLAGQLDEFMIDIEEGEEKSQLVIQRKQ